jgi:hypothetical protein
MAPLHQLPYITQTPFGNWWKIAICILLKKMQNCIMTTMTINNLKVDLTIEKAKK